MNRQNKAIIKGPARVGFSMKNRDLMQGCYILSVVLRTAIHPVLIPAI